MQKQLFPYFCGKRKGFSSKQALLSLNENRKKVLDKSFGGGMLMDLTKAFDNIKSIIFLAKLYAYCFNKN